VPGIGRFLTGTPDIAGTAAVEEGVRLLAEAGNEWLRDKGIKLTEYLIALAEAWLAPLGCPVASPPPPAPTVPPRCPCPPHAWPLPYAAGPLAASTPPRAPWRPCRASRP